MPLTVDDVVKIMEECGINTGSIELDGRTWSPDEVQLNTGTIQPNEEKLYTTTLKDVAKHGGDELGENRHPPDWRNDLEGRIAAKAPERQRLKDELAQPITSLPASIHCSWYSPVHFYGSKAGIYIREECIRAIALDIALFIDPSAPRIPPPRLHSQLVRAAFYTLFLHEQFHHKIESFGLRLMMATTPATDRYRPYKINVYHPMLGSSDCLEESLATANAYHRLDEPRYKRSLDTEVWDAAREYLLHIMPALPPGYKEGEEYIQPAEFKAGLHTLQSQVLDATAPPSTPTNRWSVATQMSRSIMDIDKRIYMIVPIGRPPMFPPKYASLSATSTTP